jgi:hypothetical protein
MEKIKSERVRRWGWVGAWAGFIYATLYVARPVCEFLKQYPWFSLSVNATIVIFIMAVLIYSFRKKYPYFAGTYILLFLVLAGYGWGITLLQIPEERLHFLEYGILAFLAYRALILDLKNGWAYVTAFVLTSLIGLGDEGIQYLLPNRYYQFQDVCLNSVSAALGLLLVFVLYRKPVSEIK